MYIIYIYMGSQIELKMKFFYDIYIYNIYIYVCC